MNTNRVLTLIRERIWHYEQTEDAAIAYTACHFGLSERDVRSTWDEWLEGDE